MNTWSEVFDRLETSGKSISLLNDASLKTCKLSVEFDYQESLHGEVKVVNGFVLLSKDGKPLYHSKMPKEYTAPSDYPEVVNELFGYGSPVNPDFWAFNTSLFAVNASAIVEPGDIVDNRIIVGFNIDHEPTLRPELWRQCQSYSFVDKTNKSTYDAALLRDYGFVVYEENAKHGRVLVPLKNMLDLTMFDKSLHLKLNLEETTTI